MIEYLIFVLQCVFSCPFVEVQFLIGAYHISGIKNILLKASIESLEQRNRAKKTDNFNNLTEIICAPRHHIIFLTSQNDPLIQKLTEHKTK